MVTVRRLAQLTKKINGSEHVVANNILSPCDDPVNREPSDIVVPAEDTDEALSNESEEESASWLPDSFISP